jgi:hypothetical protein
MASPNDSSNIVLTIDVPEHLGVLVEIDDDSSFDIDLYLTPWDTFTDDLSNIMMENPFDEMSTDEDWSAPLDVIGTPSTPTVSSVCKKYNLLESSPWVKLGFELM